VLARDGSRGLTHRAVDRELELPNGSTSYYFSRRSALLLAAAEHLAQLDRADVEATANRRDGVAELIGRWLSPAYRTRALARLELCLTAAREPAFRFMREARREFIARAAGGRRSAAAHDAGVAWIAVADGLLLHGLVSGKLTRVEVRRVLNQLRSSSSAAPRTMSNR
jgi:hypothetical protein